MKATTLIGLNYNGITVLESTEKLGNGAYLFKIKVDSDNGEEFLFKRKFEILNLMNQNKSLTTQQKNKIGKAVSNLGIIVSFEGNKYVVYDGENLLIKSAHDLEKTAVIVQQKKEEVIQNAKLLNPATLAVGQVLSDEVHGGTISGISHEMNIIQIKVEGKKYPVTYKMSTFIKRYNARLQLNDKKKAKKNKQKVVDTKRIMSIEGQLKMVFTGMINACINEKFASYKSVGAKGISVANDLDTFDKFKEWAISQNFIVGQKLSRKDKSKDFSKTNCLFI